MFIFKKEGFTLLEVVISIAILFLIAAVSLFFFSGVRNNDALEIDSKLVTSILEDARSASVSGRESSVFGVHFDDSLNTVTFFKGSTFSSGDSSNEVYDLSSFVYISSIVLTGGGDDVIFKKITGATDNSGTVTLSLTDDSRTKDVIISATGVVQ